MKFLRDNGLTLVLVTATLATLCGMVFTGLFVHNQELATHHAHKMDMGEYILSGHFLSALFENWESEFLQMSAYVVLTAFLFQRGSAESRDPDAGPAPNPDGSIGQDLAEAPVPVRMGGLSHSIYAYSLGLVLFLLFLASFYLHLRNSVAAETAQALLHGETVPTIFVHMTSAEFWFESFQNWQSEFLSTAVVVVLSIFLRFRGSPESKPVSAPNSQTGA